MPLFSSSPSSFATEPETDGEVDLMTEERQDDRRENGSRLKREEKCERGEMRKNKGKDGD